VPFSGLPRLVRALFYLCLSVCLSLCLSPFVSWFCLTDCCLTGVDSVRANKAPKMEKSRSHKKADKQKKAESRQHRNKIAEEQAAAAEAAFRARQISKRCLTCDRTFLGRGLNPHELVCKKLRKQSKAMKQASTNATNKFASLQGCAVTVVGGGDFPVPQHGGYVFPDELHPPMKLPKSWEHLLALMASAGYATVCGSVPTRGWATKEQCRRPKATFDPEVRMELRWCFDAKPRMNNYEIHKRLKYKFKLGPRVLRITQISGWVSGELGRRKKAAEAASKDVQHLIQQAEAAVAAAPEAGLEVGIDDAEIDSIFSNHLAALRKEELHEVLPAWKAAWRSARSEEWQQAANREEMARVDKLCKAVCKPKKKKQQPKKKGEASAKKPVLQGAHVQQQPKEKVATKRKRVPNAVLAEDGKGPATIAQPALQPGEAWSTCCFSPVAETELDNNRKCTDPNKCSQRMPKGKRKRSQTTKL
jgi:hypothetical protein